MKFATSFNGATEDLLAVRGLLDTYNSAVITQNAKLWLNTWANDPSWDVMGTVIQGRDNILTAWEAAMADFKFVSFMGTPGSLTLDGRTGSGICHISETLFANDGTQRNIFGLYRDQYEKSTEGNWRFKHRAYNILHEF